MLPLQATASAPRSAARERECGQVAVLFLALLVAILAMAAAALDVASWYRADRALQSTTDASALAAAQALPYDTGAA